MSMIRSDSSSDRRYTLTVQILNALVGQKSRNCRPSNWEGETALCVRCKVSLKVGDEIMSKNSIKGKKYYHESCYDGMFL